MSSTLDPFHALDTLEQNPEDAEANDCLGRWYCAVKDNWEQGLPHLAKSDDIALQILAQRELASPPVQLDDELELAAAWWDLAEQKEDDRRQLAFLRAGYWYGKAHAKMPPGLSRIRVEDRLAQIASIGRPGADVRISQPELTDGLVLMMTFEPDTFEQVDDKIRVRDLSGHENHGDVVGAKPVPSGRAGSALGLDGKEDSVLIPSLRDELTGSLKSLTISLWVRQATTSRRGFLFDMGAHDTHAVSLYYNASDTSFRFSLPTQSGGDTCRASGIATDDWRHLAAVWTGTEQKIYVDGQLIETVPTTSFAINARTVSKESARIGRQSKRGSKRSFNYFHGIIDELAIFTRALSESEIHSLYRLGLRRASLQR